MRLCAVHAATRGPSPEVGVLERLARADPVAGVVRQQALYEVQAVRGHVGDEAGDAWRSAAGGQRVTRRQRSSWGPSGRAAVKQGVRHPPAGRQQPGAAAAWPALHWELSTGHWAIVHAHHTAHQCLLWPGSYHTARPARHHHTHKWPSPQALSGQPPAHQPPVPSLAGKSKQPPCVSRNSHHV
jgi:hypothetical protein